MSELGGRRRRTPGDPEAQRHAHQPARGELAPSEPHRRVARAGGGGHRRVEHGGKTGPDSRHRCTARGNRRPPTDRPVARPSRVNLTDVRTSRTPLCRRIPPPDATRRRTRSGWRGVTRPRVPATGAAGGTGARPVEAAIGRSRRNAAPPSGGRRSNGTEVIGHPGRAGPVENRTGETVTTPITPRIIIYICGKRVRIPLEVPERDGFAPPFGAGGFP